MDVLKNEVGSQVLVAAWLTMGDVPAEGPLGPGQSAGHGGAGCQSRWPRSRQRQISQIFLPPPHSRHTPTRPPDPDIHVRSPSPPPIAALPRPRPHSRARWLLARLQ